MNIQRATPVNELLAKLIFLMLPTAAISYFLLQNVNQYYSILQNQAFQQTLYLAAGMGIAALLYSFRFRFLPTFAGLIILLYTLYKGLDKYSSSEFDAFFIARQFQVFGILFCTGWVVGWGFTRLRYWSVLLAATMLGICIYIIAKTNTSSVMSLLRAFMPAVLYAIYIIFTAEQIYNYKDKSQKFWWFLSRRLIMFTILASLLLGAVVFMQMGTLKETVDNYGGGGKQGKSNMLKENKDGTFDLNDYARLSSSLSRSKQLLFCAHINNFFPNTDIPNPLYLTAFYFTKFDTLTETFERDSTIPFNDLFEPDPSKIPLFYTKTDSSVIRNSLGAKLRQTVDIEVYSKMLSPGTYLAPNVGYFVQPIAIEKEFRGEFKFAFRAKSYVSVLNSAYFVYNAQNNAQLKAFQEERFRVLRLVTDYTGIDKKFMDYYTRMPGNDKFNTIDTLAHRIADTANTPVDKVIAIRNYFMSKDEHGDRLYKYTDNPGIPDLPNASKLMNFLNESHQGYCAYYAGATLFMLRALGIPSRIAVGFLTEDRSDKNKGWYWYYANQAHAWVQVYFPGYGWLDFDTTVGNDDEQRPTPQPDGTPPMQPPKAWLAADGVVESVDTLKKLMQMSVKQIVFHDKDYKLATPISITMDMKVGVLYRDSIALPLSKVHKGDEGTAVSYAEVMKKLEPAPMDNGATLIKRFPAEVPIDEVYLKSTEVAKPRDKQQQMAQAKAISPMDILRLALAIVALLIFLALRLPVIILDYYRIRHSSASEANKAYWAYRAASFYLHQINVPRNTLTPMQYARDVVDVRFGTSFTRFMNIYLKKKYAKQTLTAAELAYVNTFLKPFIKQVHGQIPFGKRVLAYMNPLRSIAFFMKPEDEEKES